ncbi:MAG: 30S ribosomal protein S16 [Omnitrophica WOR_2 bacterium GWF2_38_59]|nr:MAG: 30S ribosomal protein S16 [Omnitrophica WOR_2 bacterium GWA2_37_7]OGX24980.1 MAG: 30S ribosomal protein S16 [Omnitrophica WOR_2 bacterium GWF2_38_59]OGX48414.1 MAG: 30S ribosomal protein S16 [Omnitrophica WOR_2 bacterium RIFOXYA2_FULL_38_17]OGX53075.1 MAG: 30S ribosomal protein S16 [Omnitrophica WOR_2 bacterium RIFOXYA12_FULL_38_10]OGX55852.1 MAG: 30S ribosomal protein S16 [Omnitrophica WOR_2 bacterium RIFOXYC2_FULL_38_12]OGX56919.1 MAG: 30S ribosomal protein S16 [Omnitrophica WOR_2 ba
MEVKIRLQRAGQAAKGRYNYRVVAISKSRSRDGKHVEILGHYDPAKKPAVFAIDQEKLNKWLESGAIMSNTVRTLVKKENKK